MAHVVLVTTLLGRTDLFRSLNEADRIAVAAQMREATYEADQLIFSRGDPVDAMHLVVEGRVRLSVGGDDSVQQAWIKLSLSRSSSRLAKHNENADKDQTGGQRPQQR